MATMSAANTTANPWRKSFAQVAAAANLLNVPKAKEVSNGDSTHAQSQGLLASPLTQQSQAQAQAQSQSQPQLQTQGQPRPNKASLGKQPDLGAIPYVVRSPPQSLQPAQPLASLKLEPLLQTSLVVENLSAALQTTTLESQSQNQSQNQARTLAVDTTVVAKDTFDNKSVASRTTLTLDEKESLRPDDSASMQAAADEDTASGERSDIANRPPLSDPDARAFRDQLNEIDRTGAARPPVNHSAAPLPVRMPTEHHRNGGIVFPRPAGLASPNPAIGPIVLTVNESRPLAARPPQMDGLPADEKLLEALESPKDRLFVLKIEQDFIDFIKDSHEQFLQLPQTNSFYRMLSHKLADYYQLGHLIDDTMTSVRIFRTPNARLPPPLIGLDPASTGATPPPTGPARRIMRRTTDGHGRNIKSSNGRDKDELSPTSSKALSEGDSGDEGKTTPSGKNGEKGALTREERENRYKEARARIFKDFKEDATQNGDTAQGAPNEQDPSRSSSVSGAKKIVNQKKPKRPKDDGFEARSAYQQYPGPQGAYIHQLNDPMAFNGYPQLNAGFRHASEQANLISPDPYAQYGAMQHMPGQEDSLIGWTGAGYPMQQGYMGLANGSYPQLNQTMPYDVQSTMNAHGSQNTPKAASTSLAQFGSGFQANNQQSSHQPASLPNWQGIGSYNGPAANNYPAYQYNEHLNHAGQAGQFGYSTYPSPGGFVALDQQAYQMQQMPYGTMNVQQFNPQSQDFVPAYLNGVQQGAYAQQQYPVPPFLSQQGQPYPLQRQMSNTSHISGFSSPRFGFSTPNNSRGMNANKSQNTTTRSQQTANRQQPQQNSIAKWGNPATLPPKPPPPANTATFQNKASQLQQPLPPHPFAGIMNSSANGAPSISISTHNKI